MFKKRNLIIGGIILFIFMLIAVLPAAWIYLSGTKSTSNKDLQFFYIKSPISLSNLAAQLEEQGLIDNTAAFISVGSYKGLDSTSIAQGKYAIEPYTSYRTLLNGFTLNSNGNGNAEVAVEVTFNNCIDLSDLAEKVSACIDVDKNKLEAIYDEIDGLEKSKITENRLMLFDEQFRVWLLLGLFFVVFFCSIKASAPL